MKKRILSLMFVLLIALTLVACKKDPKPVVDENQDKIDEVYNTLDGLITKPDEIIADITLPKTFANGVTGEWKSSDDTLLKLDTSGSTVKGVVSRPTADEGEKKVTLSITLTLKVDGEDDLTKEWKKELTILPLDEIVATYESFKDAYEDTINGEYEFEDWKTPTLVFEGVTLYGETSNGHFLTTKDGSLAYVHGKGSMPAEGKFGNITAKVNNYHGFLQVADVNFTETEDVFEIDVKYEDKTIEDINELEPNSNDNMIYPETWLLKDVKFLIDEDISESNYNLVIVDKDFDADNADRNEDGEYFKDAVMVYYTSQEFAQLKALEGVEISELEVIYEGYRDDKHVKYVSILGVSSVKANLTDLDKLNLDKAGLTITTEFLEAGTLELPTEGENGSTITWDYKDDKNNDLIDLTNGKVILPEFGRETVNLVATLTNGEEETTKEFEITIGEYILETIEDALALEKGKKIMVKGVVTGLFANTTYGFTDENGDSIAIYTSEALTAGLEYTLVGEKDQYDGLDQLINIEINEQNPGLIPEATDITSLLDNEEGLKALVGSRVSIEGLEVIEIDNDNTYGNVNVTVQKGEVQLVVAYDSRVDDKGSTEYLEGLEVGAVLNYVGHLGWKKGYQLGYGPLTHLAEGWPVEELVEYPITIDFGSKRITGYAEGTLTFENGDGNEYTFDKDRVQINNSDYAPHDVEGFLLVFGPTGTVKKAYAELPFLTMEDLSEVSFGFTGWNENNYEQTKNLEGSSLSLEVFKDGEWVKLEDSNGDTNVFSNFKKAEYVEVKFDVEGPGLYRISYDTPNATKTGNTDYALTINKIVLK